MSLSIGSQLSANAPDRVMAPKVKAQAQAMRALGQALQNNDLDAAREAYKSVLSHAGKGLALAKDTPFADLGKALIQGDMQAAQAAWTEMTERRTDRARPPVQTLPTLPVEATANGAVATGSRLNVVA